jgi:hypothetical protein
MRSRPCMSQRELIDETTTEVCRHGVYVVQHVADTEHQRDLQVVDVGLLKADPSIL